MLKNTPETKNVKTRDEFVKVVKDWFDLMIDDTKNGKKWIYSNSQNKTSYIDARKAETPRTNCALAILHCCQIAGILKLNQKFWGKEDGTIVSKNGAVETFKKIGTITHYKKGVMPNTKKLKLSPGDIVTYYGHTNIYIGLNSKGQKVWRDAGRGTNVSCEENSYWKSFTKVGEIYMDVANVIHIETFNGVKESKDRYVVATGLSNGKFTNQHNTFNSLDNAKKDAVTAKTANKKTYYVYDTQNNNKVVYTAKYETEISYVVQCGAFSVKKNAENKAKEITRKTTLATLVKYDSGSKMYFVQCGEFVVKTNAENRKKELVEKYKVDAIIKEVKK